MDSHSRSASPREPIRPQHRPPSPPSSPAAFDNRAYQHDEADPNHNDSFTSNGTQQNGHTKEPNGETKTLEAVNLELINLTPKNGNAKKKDVEVDMNASNPYDEYFVPVNEHRKYMRGEKLYVTADKRGEKGGCKRPLCWTLLGLVVAAVVAVIVLAATGILFTNSPTTLEQYNTSISSARALGGIGHDHHDHDHHDHEHDHSTPAQTEHGPETQNDEAHDHMTSDESDSSLYVPRTVEGELKIDNEEFTPMLKDPDSNEYKEFVSTFTEGLKRALFDRNTLDYGDNDINIEVIQLGEGSVIVTYRIHWKPRINVQPSEDLLTPKSLKMKLENYLDRNDRMISSYHVAEDKMISRPVLDICQINKYDCDHGCEFNERTLDFTCTCPPGLMLDMTDLKKCMSILESPVDDIQQPHEEPEKTDKMPEPNITTMKSTPEEEILATEQPHVHEHENTFDWKETHHMMPVTTTEAEADVNFSHIFGHEEHEHETESSIENHDIEEHDINSVQETEPKPQPEPEPEPTSEPHPLEEPQPSAEPQPAVEPESTAEQKPTIEPEPAPEPEPVPEPEPSPEPEPVAEPEPSPEPEPTAEPAPKPEPTAVPEPAAEPQPTTEPQPAEEPKIMPELLPTHEPQPADESHSVDTQAIEEPQPSSEPQPALETQDDSQTDAKINFEPRPEPEPTSEPHVEHDSEINDGYKHSVHMFQPEIEPTAEPQPNSEPEPQTETAVRTENESDMQTTTKPQVVENHEIPEVLLHVSEHEENTGESTGRALDQENNITSEEKAINMEENVDSRLSTTVNSMETTTMRISISEPNIINEPSYEPKPEIISILNDNKEPTNGPVFVSNEPNESTTKHNDWLENNTQPIMKDSASDFEEEKSTESNFPSNIDAIMKYLTPDHGDESESRSFKHIDIETTAETTTTKSNPKLEEEVTMDPITKENEVSVTDSIGKVEEETTTTKPFVSMFSDININESEKNSKEGNDLKTTTALPSFIHEHKDQTTILTNNRVVEIAESTTRKEDTLGNEPNVTSSTEEAKMLDSKNVKPIETTTLESEIVTEYSIITHHKSSEEGKQLMEVLNNKNQPESNENSSETNDVPDEGMDITFDAINQLFNRSSKSIETLNKTNSEAPEMNNILKDDLSTTTESDWLSEAVTETNYEEAMNKMEKQETTEATVPKIDEIMNRELTKDDFEPDYLNNMGPGNKGTEQEEPAYGMVHDYDNEDSRVKRVHTEMTTESVVNEVKNMTQEITTETSPATNVPMETTTVSEYIYKSAERTPNQEGETTKQTSDDSVMSVISHLPVTAAPAPVWEESEGDKELTVKELMNKEINDITTTRPVMIDEIIVPTTVSAIPTSIAPIPTTASPIITTLTPTATIQTENKGENDSGNELDTAEARNGTQVNNLNVTIYEISSHNSNTTVASPKTTNANSAEYEDHETEMNPFLPEVENNKSLVKKLQEGHDIEQMINETQNENVEDHSVPSEGNSSSDDGLAVISKGNEEPSLTTTVSSAEGDTSFNELLMNIKTHENATEPPRTNAPEVTIKPVELSSNEENNKMAKPHEKEILPVSTFLMDTDDLDTYKPIATKIRSESDIVRPVGPVRVNSDSQFLSVVPIEERKEEEEAIKGNYKKDNIQELNAISDSPKKSDRRTLDETKFDAVINNEA